MVHLRHFLGQSEKFEMGKQLSEVSNSEFYLMNFRQKLILLIFLQHCRPHLGHCFLAPRLEILHTSQVCICLGICFEFFSSGPIQRKFVGGAIWSILQIQAGWGLRKKKSKQISRHM